jgi:Holliday junction resolvase RusA-like endonuclease
MKVSFAVEIKPQPQGSIQSFILPNKEAVESAAKTIRISPNLSLAGIIGLITEACKKVRAILTSDNTNLKAYRREVSRGAADAMLKAGAEMAEKHVPVAMAVDFTFLKPPSVTKKRVEMTVRPDIDKCLRSCLDACTGVLWLDDAQVIAIATRKRYGPVEGVSISAWTVDDQAALPGELFPELEAPTAF